MGKVDERERNAFEVGFEELQSKYVRRARRDIMKLLNVETTQAFYQRRRGEVEGTDEQREGIEVIFEKYGVDKNNVWGLSADSKP